MKVPDSYLAGPDHRFLHVFIPDLGYSDVN